MPIPPKTTLTERAYEAIRNGILRGEMQEGVFLSEGEITRRYEIGRTPYREACNRLHREGLLEAVPRRGYLVPEISFHAMRDLLERGRNRPAGQLFQAARGASRRVG